MQPTQKTEGKDATEIRENANSAAQVVKSDGQQDYDRPDATEPESSPPASPNAGANTRPARIEVKCTREKKAEWIKKAEARSLDISELVRQSLDGVEMPRASQAAQSYRRLCELLVLTVQRLEQVRVALEARKAPATVIFAYLAHMYDIHDTLRLMPREQTSGDPAQGNRADDVQPETPAPKTATQ